MCTDFFTNLLCTANENFGNHCVKTKSLHTATKKFYIKSMYFNSKLIAILRLVFRNTLVFFIFYYRSGKLGNKKTQRSLQSYICVLKILINIQLFNFPKNLKDLVLFINALNRVFPAIMLVINKFSLSSNTHKILQLWNCLIKLRFFADYDNLII